MTHLEEIKQLVAESIARAIDLLPDGESMPSPADARANGVQLLHNLRCIHHEAELEELGAP
jgi:hypothetical protein